MEYDVAIVGAGLAGLYAARRLSRAGLRVLLTDRKARVDQRVHTTGIFVRRTFVDYVLPELGEAIAHVYLYSPRGKALALQSSKAEFRVGDMAALYRRLLDEGLEAGLSWWPCHHWLGLDAKRVFLLGPEGRREVRARYVVGADGAHSVVARDLGLSLNRRWLVALEDVYDAPRAAAPELHCFLDPELAPGYIAWVVQADGHLHVGVGGLGASFAPRQALERFQAKVAERFALQSLARRERRGGRIPVGGILPHIGNARGLLIGDASGAVSPLTAGGLDPALRLGDYACHLLERQLRDPGENWISQYRSAPFRRRFWLKQRFRERLTRFRSRGLLEFAFRLLSYPPGLNLARYIFFSRGSFPVFWKD